MNKAAWNRMIDEAAVFAGKSRAEILSLDFVTFTALIETVRARRSAS